VSHCILEVLSPLSCGTLNSTILIAIILLKSHTVYENQISQQVKSKSTFRALHCWLGNRNSPWLVKKSCSGNPNPEYPGKPGPLAAIGPCKHSRGISVCSVMIFTAFYTLSQRIMSRIYITSLHIDITTHQTGSAYWLRPQLH